jgi:hypothetical protein
MTHDNKKCSSTEIELQIRQIIIDSKSKPDISPRHKEALIDLEETLAAIDNERKTPNDSSGLLELLLERARNASHFVQELQAWAESIPPFEAKIINPIKRISQYIRKDSVDDHITVAVLLENSRHFTYVLEKACREGVHDLSHLRIDIYEILKVYDDPLRCDELLPIQGVVKSEAIADCTFTIIEEKYPPRLPNESAEAAAAAREKLKQDRFEARKQEITNIIAKAMLCVIQDERLGEDMPAETNLAKQIVRLLQDIIICGAEVIYQKQKESAQGWHVAYPYNDPIMVFHRIADALNLDQMGTKTPMKTEDWETPQFNKIIESLKMFSQWQDRLGEDQEENLYLIRKHLRPIALQILDQVSESYGFWIPSQISAQLASIEAFPRTTNLFSDKSNDNDELTLDDELEAPGFKALVDEFNLLFIRLMRITQKQKITPIAVPVPVTVRKERDCADTKPDVATAEDAARANKGLIRQMLTDIIAQNLAGGYKFILDVLDNSDRILMEDTLFKKWVQKYGIQCWSDIADHKTTRQYFQQFISKLKKN